MAANRMARFEPFIGTWNTTGEMLATESSPAGTLSATDTYRWLPGKHFIVHEVDARLDGAPTRAMEVMGYDAERRCYFARSYDDQGATALYELELKGRRWRIRGESQRFAGSFSDDMEQLTGLWELKSSKGNWQPWIRLKLVRS